MSGGENAKGMGGRWQFRKEQVCERDTVLVITPHPCPWPLPWHKQVKTLLGSRAPREVEQRAREDRGAGETVAAPLLGLGPR